MKIPRTFILDRNFDEKIKELSEKYLKLPKEELYRHAINKYDFFKPDEKNNSLSHSNLCLAILSILKDESYFFVTSYEPRYKKKHKANNKLISIITLFDETYRIGY